MTAQDSIPIKGTREGLLVTLPAALGAWSETLAQLEAKLSASPAFFKGARVGLVVGPRGLSEDDIRSAREMLLRHDVTLWALISENGFTQNEAAHLGLDNKLPARESRQPPAEPVNVAEPSPLPAPTARVAPVVPEPVMAAPVEDPDAAMMVRRTLRSGIRVHHPGSIIVLGDVHPGAEVVAGGDVVVWGKLHGTVHAGALGDNGAVVCALDFAPTQLRIGHFITRSPDEHRRKAQPEMGRVKNGRIEVVLWSSKGSDR
jgi:septum site-determining protein MinC